MSCKKPTLFPDLRLPASSGFSVFCCQGTLAYTGVYCLTYNRRYGALFLRYATPPTFFIPRLTSPSRSVFSSPIGIAVYYHNYSSTSSINFKKIKNIFSNIRSRTCILPVSHYNHYETQISAQASSIGVG